MQVASIRKAKRLLDMLEASIEDLIETNIQDPLIDTRIAEYDVVYANLERLKADYRASKK